MTTIDMDSLREEILDVDRRIVELIARRVDLARRIGRAKREAGIGALDPAREAAVVREAAALARDAGLDADEIRAIFWRLIGLCRATQHEEVAS